MKDETITKELIRDIWYTEYKQLNAKNSIPKEQIEGDYVFVTTVDATTAIPQCFAMEKKPYILVRHAKND